jgi:hypothetical protein
MTVYYSALSLSISLSLCLSLSRSLYLYLSLSRSLYLYLSLSLSLSVSRASFRVFLRSLCLARADIHSCARSRIDAFTHADRTETQDLLCRSLLQKRSRQKLRFCSRDLHKQRPTLLQQRPTAKAETSASAAETYCRSRDLCFCSRDLLMKPTTDSHLHQRF